MAILSLTENLILLKEVDDKILSKKLTSLQKLFKFSIFFISTKPGQMLHASSLLDVPRTKLS